MVLTLSLEAPEAAAAAAIAAESGGELVVVPRVDGRYASVGVIAEVLEIGQLPGGPRAVVVSGRARARLGIAVHGGGDALLVQAEPVEEEPESDAVAELAREYRAVLENILLIRGARGMAERLRQVTGAGADR